MTNPIDTDFSAVEARVAAAMGPTLDEFHRATEAMRTLGMTFGEVHDASCMTVGSMQNLGATLDTVTAQFPRSWYSIPIDEEAAAFLATDSPLGTGRNIEQGSFMDVFDSFPEIAQRLGVSTTEEGPRFSYSGPTPITDTYRTAEFRTLLNGTALSLLAQHYQDIYTCEPGYVHVDGRSIENLVDHPIRFVGNCIRQDRSRSQFPEDHMLRCSLIRYWVDETVSNPENRATLGNLLPDLVQDAMRAIDGEMPPPRQLALERRLDSLPVLYSDTLWMAQRHTSFLVESVLHTTAAVQGRNAAFTENWIDRTIRLYASHSEREARELLARLAGMDGPKAVAAPPVPPVKRTLYTPKRLVMGRAVQVVSLPDGTVTLIPKADGTE